MSVGLLLRQSPPHFALDTCFGWAQKSIFLRYLEYTCVSVCVCVEDFCVVCFYPPVYYTHTRLPSRTCAPSRFVCPDYLPPPFLPGAAGRYLMWSHAATSTSCNCSFLPCVVGSPVHTCPHAYLSRSNKPARVEAGTPQCAPTRHGR